MKARSFAQLFSMFSFAGILGLSAVVQAAPALPVARDFEIGRFAGGWYEVASMSSQISRLRSDAIAAFATSEQFPDTLQATFTYRSFISEQVVSGVLSPADSRYPATLLFTWSRPPVTHSDFYVLAVADDYSWALIGDQARKNAYVYSRSTSVDPGVLRSLIIRLDTDFDFVQPERSMHCTLHNGAPLDGCAEILD